MLTRIWNRFCEWLAEPVYLQTIPWTWTVKEPQQPALATDPHAETLTVSRAGIKVWAFQSRNMTQQPSPENWRNKRYSLPETWKQVRQQENSEEQLS
jgi:hypothetical protein